MATDSEVDGAGRIVVVGTVGNTGGCGSVDGFSYGVARLHTDGSLDTSFGKQGKVNTEFSERPSGGSTSTPRPTTVAIDSRGRIVLSARTGDRMALAMFFGGDREGGDDGGGGGEGGSGAGGGGVEGGAAGGGVGLRIHRVVVPKSAAALINRGVRVLASCATRCKLSVSVGVGAGIANALGLRTTMIARGTASTAANKRRWVVARLTPAAAEALRTYGGGGRLQISVRAVGPGAQSAMASVAG
jgi:hypothetical protein